ncbi:GNAT family N-acetyltransferase [Janthinobacterium sp. PC23-8]|uniref:GNAT family N-acetyltransferase n=1 Tax=Janthinobacterium sp. PC23-8 TaxID=2012679 RepID=UPI000B96C193|nr:GNAT family protein [Janthinobacterium sp. PC23-8]OYO29110.1 hypothetical protein CD932_18550 [Janthinobacterium sp. PC23-8]
MRVFYVSQIQYLKNLKDVNLTTLLYHQAFSLQLALLEKTSMHQIASALAGISIIPTLAQHAPQLALLVRENINHLQTWLPKVAQLAGEDEARAYLERVSERDVDATLLEWHIFSGADLCGSIRLKEIDHEDRTAAIGYYLGSRFQGKGIGTASVRAVLGHAFGVLGLNRIEMQCAAANRSSMALGQRLGFTLEGVLREAECLNGVFVDLHSHALLRKEFLQDGA